MSFPKEQVKNIISTTTTTIDDDATPAFIIYMYAGGPETLKWLFYVLGFDVVVTVDDPTVANRRWIQDVPEHHPEAVEVVVTTIDKAGVTGTKMQEKMRAALRATVEASAHGVNYILRMPDERPQSRRKGGLDRVWETRYTITWMDA